jgi:hypothetical protein
LGVKFIFRKEATNLQKGGKLLQKGVKREQFLKFTRGQSFKKWDRGVKKEAYTLLGGVVTSLW